jgi:hypothetical protein
LIPLSVSSSIHARDTRLKETIANAMLPSAVAQANNYQPLTELLLKDIKCSCPSASSSDPPPNAASCENCCLTSNFSAKIFRGKGRKYVDNILEDEGYPAVVSMSFSTALSTAKALFQTARPSPDPITLHPSFYNDLTGEPIYDPSRYSIQIPEFKSSPGEHGFATSLAANKLWMSLPSPLAHSFVLPDPNIPKPTLLQLHSETFSEVQDVEPKLLHATAALDLLSLDVPLKIVPDSYRKHNSNKSTIFMSTLIRPVDLRPNVTSWKISVDDATIVTISLADPVFFSNSPGWCRSSAPSTDNSPPPPPAPVKPTSAWARGPPPRRSAPAHRPNSTTRPPAQVTLRPSVPPRPPQMKPNDPLRRYGPPGYAIPPTSAANSAAGFYMPDPRLYPYPTPPPPFSSFHPHNPPTIHPTINPYDLLAGNTDTDMAEQHTAGPTKRTVPDSTN